MEVLNGFNGKILCTGIFQCQLGVGHAMQPSANGDQRGVQLGLKMGILNHTNCRGAISKLMDAYGDSTHVSLQAFDSCPYCIFKKIRRWTTQTEACSVVYGLKKGQEQQHIKRTPAHSGCFMLCSSLGRWGPHLFGQQTSGYGNHDCFKQLGLPMIAIILVLKCAPHKIRFVPHGLGRRHVANSLESFPGPREGSVGSIWTK